MSKQQEIIKNIMHALDTNEGGSSGLDKAIRENTSFSGTQDAIDHFVAARDRYSSADAFLREACGIVLDNEDTGALTGSDAGSGTVKTAASVVPNYGATRDGESNVYNVNGTKFTFYGQKFPDIFYYYRTNNQKMQERQLSWRQYAEGSGFYKTASKMSYDLVHYIMAPALSLVEETYGLSLTENGSKTNTIYIGFSNVGSDFSTQNTLAQTGLRYYYRYNSTSRQPTTLIRLVYDVNAFYDPDKDIDYLRYSQGSQDGRRSKYSTMYLDRVTAHELTHAVMQANIDNFNDLPLWFVEGSAELPQGADDTRTSDIRSAAASSASLSRAIREASGTLSSAGSEPDSAYYAGYMLLRYIAQQGAGGTERAKSAKSDIVTLSDGTLYLATDAADLYVGNPGRASRIQAGSKAAMMWGGGSASDTFVAGTGTDTYWIGANDGHDTVTGFKKGQDAVYCWSGASALTGMLSGSDLYLSPDAAANSLTLQNVTKSSYGTVELQRPGAATAYLGVGTVGNMHCLDATTYDGYVLLVGDAGYASDLQAGSGGSAMWGGGSQSDELVGGAGADTFWFGKGDGEDIVYGADTSDTVYLWNVDDIRELSIQPDDGFTNALDLTLSGGSTLSIFSHAGAADLSGMPAIQLANGERYRMTGSSSQVALRRI